MGLFIVYQKDPQVFLLGPTQICQPVFHVILCEHSRMLTNHVPVPHTLLQSAAFPRAHRSSVIRQSFPHVDQTASQPSTPLISPPHLFLLLVFLHPFLSFSFLFYSILFIISVSLTSYVVSSPLPALLSLILSSLIHYFLYSTLSFFPLCLEYCWLMSH